MRTGTFRPIFVTAVLITCGSFGAPVQQHGQHQGGAQGKHPMMQHDMSATMAEMMKEPHHLLAMAYMQNVGAFARALQEHSKDASAISAEFARAAAAEIRRSFDEFDMHMKEHMRTAAHPKMSGDMRSHMDQMMKDMNAHQSRLKEAVAALEKDARAANLDAKRIAAGSAEIVRHLDEMSKMHGHPGERMMEEPHDGHGR